MTNVYLVLFIIFSILFVFFELKYSNRFWKIIIKKVYFVLFILFLAFFISHISTMQSPLPNEPVPNKPTATKPELVVQTGEGYVLDIALSPDKKLVLSGSAATDNKNATQTESSLNHSDSVLQPNSLSPEQEKQLELIEKYNSQVVQYYDQGHFEQALPLAEKTYFLSQEILGEKHPETIISLNNLAWTYKDLGRLSEALQLFEQAYSLRKEVLGEQHPKTLNSLAWLTAMQKFNALSPEQKKQLELAKKYNSEAFQYYQQKEFEKALPLFKEAYRIRKEVLGEKHPKTIMSLNNLTQTYHELGDLQDFLPLFEKVYHFSEEVFGEKNPDTLRILNNLVVVYKKLGGLLDALPLAEKNYSFHKEILGEKHPNTLIGLDILAQIYQDLGHFSKALPLYEKAYRLREVLGKEHPDTIISLNNLAFIYQAIGRLSDALPLSEKGYHLSQDILGKKHSETLRSLNNLAFIYRTVGRLPYAVYLSKESYHLTKEVLGEKHPKTLISLNNLADIYQVVGRLSESLLLFEKGYHLSQEVLGEKHIGTLRYLNNLANIYQAMGRLSDALSLFIKVYSLSQELLGEKHPYTITSLNNLAGIYLNLGISPEFLSLPLLEESYRLNKEILGKHHLQTLKTINNLAYTYQTQGNIKKAIKHFEKLVKGVETLRQTGNLSAENRQALFKEWIPRYFTLSDLYIKQSRFVDAFRLAELSKSRTLLESLAAKRAAQASGLSKTEQEKLQDYEMHLASFNNQIGKAIESNRLEDRVRLETDKNQIIAELAQFEQQLRAKYPKYEQLSQVQIITAEIGAKLLSKNAVFISYLVNENHVLAFTLENNGKLAAHDLGEIPDFEKDLETYRLGLAPVQDSKRGKVIRLATSEREQEMQALSKKLGKRLLEPLKDHIKDKSHWIISPSGALALIPFGNLYLENKKQPIIAQHQISYVQSLSVLAMLKKRDQNYQQIQNRANLFAMGAPIYEQFEQTATADKLPSEFDFKIARGLAQHNDYNRAFKQLDLTWQNLPGTLEELTALKQIFTGATIYKQKEATETKLQSLNEQNLLEKYRYLVFAAHGYLSQEVPMLSSLVLGQVNNPEGIDGYVTAGEWPGYDLKSDLMVLSACETGLGEVVGGEGVMGLPYALFVAGNKNTLLTLWSISDDITAEFMASFFQKLKAGQAQIEALTATKREFINKGGKYANPKYWAAFVLYGV